MKYLADFSPSEQEWFDGTFASGRRHLEDERFTSFYCSASVHANDVLMFSYSVSDDAENFYGVVPDPHAPGSGQVLNSEGTQIVFLGDAGIEGVKDVFGPTFLGIHILSVNGNLDGIVTFELDSPNSFFVEPAEGHAMLSLHALGFLYRRARSS